MVKIRNNLLTDILQISEKTSIIEKRCNNANMINWNKFLKGWELVYQHYSPSFFLRLYYQLFGKKTKIEKPQSFKKICQ